MSSRDTLTQEQAAFLRRLLEANRPLVPDNTELPLARQIGLQLQGLVQPVLHFDQKTQLALSSKGRKVAALTDMADALARYNAVDALLRSLGWHNPKGGFAEMPSGVSVDCTFEGGGVWRWTLRYHARKLEGVAEWDGLDAWALPTPDEAIARLLQGESDGVAAA